LLAGFHLEEIRPTRPQVVDEPHRLIEESMLEAGFVPFLEAVVRSKTPLTILVNDADRLTDSRIALEAFLELKRAHGLTPRVRVLFACGSHNYTAGQRRRHEKSVLPEELSVDAELSWHDSLDAELHRAIGDTYLHYWVVEGESHLAVGSMEPHYFAGVTGAHKTLTVGVMSYESLRRNHENALSSEACGLKLEGNPVYEAIAAVVRRLRDDGKRMFAVDEVLADGGLVACTAGDPLEALARGLPTVRRVFSRSLSQQVDLIVARVRPPRDKSRYQADKGIKNVEAAVRDGGVILLEARCPEGVGIDRFYKMMQKAPTYEKTLALVQKDGYTLGDHKAVRLRALTERRGVRLGIVQSHLGAEEARIVGLEPFSRREDATRWALSQLGEDAKTAALVEDAGNVTLSLH
jgi:nickel-dependent lactate racemase